MDYRAKLCEFVDDLNRIANDRLRFPEYRGGLFELSIIDGVINNNGVDAPAVRIELVFREQDAKHVVFFKTELSSNETFYHAYFDILRGGILGINSVGQMKDLFGHDINFLNFATLLTEGLKKLKTT